MTWTKRVNSFFFLKLKNVGFLREVVWRLKSRAGSNNVWRGFPPNNKIPRLLESGRYDEVINYAVRKVLKDAEDTAYRRCSSDRHVVLSGYRRSGKTAVSHVLARQFQYFVVPVDELRRCWRMIDEPEIQTYIRHEIIKKILELSKVRVCLEGDSFIYGGWTVNTLFPQVDLSFAETLSSLPGSRLVLIGSADCDIYTKCKSLEVHRQAGLCWTAKHTESERMRIVEESIKVSKLLKSASSSIPAEYYEVDLNSFESSINSIAEKISGQCNSQY